MRTESLEFSLKPLKPFRVNFVLKKFPETVESVTKRATLQHMETGHANTGFVTVQ